MVPRLDPHVKPHTNPHLEALANTKYGSLWLDQDVRPESLAHLAKDETCQLLIVGGGFTGLWAALQAKERMPDCDVILIESTTIGDGASGRNGGMLHASLTHGANNADHHFPGERDRIIELGRRNLKELLESLERYGIDAQYENVGSMSVATDESQATSLRRAYARRIASGADVVWFDQDAVRQEVNSPTYLGGLWSRGGQDGIVDPARLCWGLKAAVLSLGVQMFEGTPLLSISPDGTGMRASCAHGAVRSEKILMATNAFPSPLEPIRKSVIPVWDYQLATEPLTQAQLAAIRWGETRHSLSNEAEMFHYYRMTQDNRITWGGGGSVCYYYGGRTGPGVADPRGRFERLSKEFFETFPQLEGVRFSHRWGGIIATSTRFCMVPGVAYDNRVSWAVGYTGARRGSKPIRSKGGVRVTRLPAQRRSQPPVCAEEGAELAPGTTALGRRHADPTRDGKRRCPRWQAGLLAQAPGSSELGFAC
jgi:glycine/D-amino acid oxidase-like deaminating enzyme